MATHESNTTPAIVWQVKPQFNYDDHWLGRLTEQPALSPHFTRVLHGRISQTILDWLTANAPSELVALQHCQGILENYNAEFEASRGFVSDDSNKSVISTIQEAINTLDKIGAGDFEAMG